MSIDTNATGTRGFWADPLARASGWYGHERGPGSLFRAGRLINATRQTFDIDEVAAHAPCLSYNNMAPVNKSGGTPLIASKAMTPEPDGGLFKKMFHFYNLKRDEFLKHSHKRSNVEIKFSMIKAKIGDSLRSRTDTAMVNETLREILRHNICCLIRSDYELGINAMFLGTQQLQSALVVPLPVKPVTMGMWASVSHCTQGPPARAD